MTVVSRDTRYRVVGCEYGGYHIGAAAGTQKWGEPGDRCQVPGCDAILSDYNDRDRCSCHMVRGARRNPRKRGEVASAGGSVACETAPPPRRVTMEEVEMAARSRKAAKGLDAAVRAFAESQPWATYFTSRECAEAIGCGESTAKKRLTRLVEEGLLCSSTARGYALQKRKDAPAGPVGAAPGTTETGPEQPASPPAPDPYMREPAAAGAVTSTAADCGSLTTGSVVRWADLQNVRPGFPVTVTVDFDIDLLAEAVMARIAERMVGK